MNNFYLISKRYARKILVRVFMVFLGIVLPIELQYRKLGNGIKKSKAAILKKELQPYLFLCFDLVQLGQLSDVLCKTRLQVCSLVVVDNVDLSQLV